jgi:hypothetical protein
MIDCKSSLTPFLSEVRLEDGGDTPLVEKTLNKQLVGSFLYLTHSRLDLSYEFGAVFRFMQEPHELHWKDENSILQYVHGTITFGIHYTTDSILDLIRFIDSDWDGDNIDLKSTSGYSLSLGSRPICWSIKKKEDISLSLARGRV